MHKDTGYEKLGVLVDSEPFCEFPDGDEDGLSLPADTFSGGETITVPLTITVNPKLLKSGRYGGLETEDDKPNPLRYIYVNIWILVDVAGELEVDHLLGTGSGGKGTGVASFALDTFAVDPDAHWGGAPFGVYSIDLELPEVPFPSAAILRVRLDYGEDAGRPDLKGMNPLNDPLYFGDCGSSRSGEVEEYQVLLIPEE